MYWKISIISLLAIVACQPEKQSTDTAITEPFPEINYVIQVSELRPMLSQKNIKLIDFRKKEDYDQGHIEGALNIWRSDIEDDSYRSPAVPGRAEIFHKMVKTRTQRPKHDER